MEMDLFVDAPAIVTSMSTLAAKPINRLLASLPSETIERLRLRQVTLKSKQVVMRADRNIDYVYFPTHGIVSALAVMTNGAAIEVGCIGSEGLVGVSVVLGTTIAAHNGIVQMPGEALRTSAQTLSDACAIDPRLRGLLFRYQSYFLSHVSQSAACNGLHSIIQRCCRWLLTMHRGAHTNDIRITHELMAATLGVQRPGVTLALNELQSAGLIENGRARITILDRERLEAVACECYRELNNRYARLLS
jgi:CRP-like cAMP-binding protein